MSDQQQDPIEAARARAQATLADVGGCALLVGVEDYPHFPRQALLAGRNDVLTYWKVCRRLGYRASDIRVRTSPVLEPEDIVRAELELALGRKENRGKPRAEIRAAVEARLAGVAWDEVLGPATHAGIVEGAKWLSRRLVFTFRAEWEGRAVREELAALPGLLAYSGHGAQLGSELALCPSDVEKKGDGLDNALTFAALRTMLDAGDDLPGKGCAPTDNLTVILDCCFAAGADDDAKLTTSLTPAGTAPLGANAAIPEIGPRVFCASGRDEQAYQALLGGRWHGAFTWAMTRALEQWKTAPSGQFKRMTVSHAELLFRARMLLEALSFPQHPVLVDKIGNTPVFWHESDAEGKKQTKGEPDTKRPGVQLDPTTGHPFTEFLLRDSLGNVAVAIVPLATWTDPSNGVRWDAGTEYWHMYRALNTSTGTGWVLSILGGPTPSQPQACCVTIPTAASWTHDEYSMDLVFIIGETFIFGLTADVTTSGTGFITWFNWQDRNLLFTNLPESHALAAGGGVRHHSYRASNTI